MPVPSEEDVRLRAKYHDWCSAKIVEQFLSLSPEEVYQLAQPGEQPGNVVPEASALEAAAAAASPIASPTAQEASYRQLVQRVTEVLLERTDLPSFEEWSAAYGEDPGRFESEMLGFWQSPESDDQA